MTVTIRPLGQLKGSFQQPNTDLYRAWTNCA